MPKPYTTAKDAMRWTAVQDEALALLIRDKRKTKEIASLLRRSPSSIDNRRVRLGLCRYRWVGAEATARIDAILFADPGRTNPSVARECGVTKVKVRRRRRLLGIPPVSRSGAATIVNLARQAAARLKPTPGQNEVVALLADGPLSVPQMALILNRNRTSIRDRLVRAREKGLAFAEGKGGWYGLLWSSTEWWLKTHDKLVWSIANKIHAQNRSVPVEDIVTDVRIGVLRAVRLYRPATGAAFASYAYRAATMGGYFFAATEKRRGVHVPTDKIFDSVHGARPGDLEYEDGDTIPVPVSDLDPELESVWDHVTRLLPARTAGIVLAHFRDGKSRRTIADEFNVSHQRVHQIIDKAQEKLATCRALQELVS